MSSRRVSVAIALHDEAEVFPELVRRLGSVLDELPDGPHEIVLVDDGSTDATWSLILEAAASDNRIVGLRLSRNFGHQAALTAALERVTGDLVVVMDGDLQDRPEEIPRFVAEYDRGYDVVYAIRVGRKESRPLRAAYHLFYRLMARLSEVAVPVDSGDFALLSRRVVDQLNELPERHRYIRGLRTWVGFQQTGIEVERDARAAGKPSYTLRKLFGLGSDGIFAFSIAPLRAAWLFGAVAVGTRSALRAVRDLPATVPRHVTTGLHRAHRRDHLLRGRPAPLPRTDRGVPWQGLRRDERKAALHSHGHRVTRQRPGAFDNRAAD